MPTDYDDESLPNGCYAEVRIPRSWGTHDASSAPSNHCATNTDPLLTEEEQRVLDLLDMQYKHAHADFSLKGADDDGQLVDGTVPCQGPSPPFAPEISVAKLLDALWVTRYRPLVVRNLELRRQRAARVAAHRAKRATSPNLSAVSPTMSQRNGASSFTTAGAAAATATVSPPVQPLVPAALGGPSNFLLAFPSPGSDSLSFASGASFELGSSTSTTFYRQLLIPVEDLVPQHFPLKSVQAALRGATNKTLRSLFPSAENIAELYTDGEEGKNDSSPANSIRPVASAAAYLGREFVCRCLLDLIALCPNIQCVSIAGHHAPPDTIEALVAVIGSQHPSLSTVDLRGNVIEVPVARALARAIRDNPRITKINFDKGNLLLRSTEARLNALLEENRQKMNTVCKIRNEWTQTTLLPHELPKDLSEYFLGGVS